MQWRHQIICLNVLNCFTVMCTVIFDRNQPSHALRSHGQTVRETSHSQSNPSTGRKARIDYDLWQANSTRTDNIYWGDPDPNPWKLMVNYSANVRSQIDAPFKKIGSSKSAMPSSPNELKEVKSNAGIPVIRITEATPHTNNGEVTEVILGTSVTIVDNVSGAGEKDHVTHDRMIPLQILRNLNSIHNFNDFYKYFFKTTVPANMGMVEPFGHDDPSFNIEGRKTMLPTANVPVAVPAPCIPALEVVPLPIKMDPSAIVWPTCTRIERCGGCCSSDLLKCEADTLELVQLNVIKSSYVGNGQFQYSGMETVSVEKHLSCRCGCRVKESHCTTSQKYDEAECRCRCADDMKRDLCSREHGTKFWDPQSCLCKCRRETMCSTGMYFSHDICKCTQIPLSGRSYSSENELFDKGLSPQPITTTTTEKTWESWLQSIKVWKKRNQ